MDHQKSGELKEAREMFAACRKSACLPAVRKECGKQYEQVESDIRNAGSSKSAATVDASAPAAPSGPSCGGAWRQAVEKQKAGHLNEARELFAACRQASCLPAVRKECVKQYDQLESDIPSVVAIVTDDAGEPRTDVEIKCDGHLLASQLDGRSVAVDPGVHEFSFSKDGDVFATQKIMVAEGQHHRLISAAVPGPGGNAADQPAPKKLMPAVAKRRMAQAQQDPAKVNLAVTPAVAKQATEDAEGSDSASSSSADATLVAKPESRSRVPAGTYLLGATGLAGLGGYALATYWGRKDNNMLASCSPHCEQSNVDHVHKLYLAADVSLGVGIAALGAAYWVYSARHNSSVGKEETAPTQEALRVDVAPTSSGAVASVSGRF